MRFFSNCCILFLSAILLCAISSCQKTATSGGRFDVVKFSASFDNTKIVQDDKGKSLWEEGDAIDIFYNVGTYYSGTWAYADRSGATTTFTTAEDIPTDKNLYVAVYPSDWQTRSCDAWFEEDELKISLKETSDAHTFASCAICKASTTKAGGNLEFSNICSMLKYSSSNEKVSEASLYVDNSTRRIRLTSNNALSESTYYATLACGYKSSGSVHIDNLGLRLTSRSTGVDYPAYYSNVNSNFEDSHIYNIGNVEEKIFSDESKAGEVSSLRLMSFNILRGDLNEDHLWEGGTNPRKDACIAMISENAPDIINLQECSPKQRRDILDKFPKYGAVGLCVNGKLEDVNNVSSNSIIYNGDKLFVEDFGHYWFSDTPSTAGSYTWHAKKPRNLVWTRFKIKGSEKRFICISMHLQNNGELYYDDGTKITDASDLQTYGEDNRIRSVNLILNTVLPSINTDGLPVILSGDCNSVLTSPALKNLQTTLTAAAELAPSGCRDTGYTFNGFVTSGKSRIDHIFSKNCTHLNYCVDRHSYAGITFVSDHWPVYTDFRILESQSFDSALEGWTQDNVNTGI